MPFWGACPIYYGCPNLDDYFPRGAYVSIDLDNFEESISIIEDTNASKTHENSVEEIAAARDLILDKYNLFATPARICTEPQARIELVKVELRPELVFGKVKRLIGGTISGGVVELAPEYERLSLGSASFTGTCNPALNAKPLDWTDTQTYSTKATSSCGSDDCVE